MARRRGLKLWDEITVEGWLSLMGEPSVMSQLMMQIFSRLYHSEDYMDNAKNIAEALHMEYRALNAGVGWAGNKIREMYEKGELLTYHGTAVSSEEVPSEAESTEFQLRETPQQVISRSPWEYVFDGAEGEGGIYYWILKPEAVTAYRELMDADLWNLDPLARVLEADVTAAGVEGNLFSESSESTVERLRRMISDQQVFRRKSMADDPCCVVCGCHRISLLQAVPYGVRGIGQKGLLFCPTHAALFAAHLISFSPKGELLISSSLDEEERKLYGLTAGSQAKGPFSGRRMTVHRKLFDQEERKRK